MTLVTERLTLRAWREQDRAPFAALNADPGTMRYFPRTFTRAESDALVDRFQAAIDGQGWGIWAAERRDTGAFIGFVGLATVSFEAAFTPAVEVGWRLDRAHWGQGFATEGGRAALGHGFGELGLDRIVSFTALENRPSEAVMVRLGMARVAEFTHPRVPEGSPLRRHVLYAADAPAG